MFALDVDLEVLKAEVKPLKLGSIRSLDDKLLLENCPFCRKVLWGNLHNRHGTWLMCSLDSEHCLSGGFKVRFCFVRGKGYRVEWNCPKIVGLVSGV